MYSLNVEDMLPVAEMPLFWVGAFTVASLSLWVLHRLLQGFRIWVWGNGQLLSPKLGKWAVVTGATDGIGKVYVEELARKGFAVILISRSQDKLDDVARQLEEQYKVETKTIAVDFGLSDIYPKIEAGLAGLEIGVLVNNVGISYPYPEYFLHIPDLDNFITNMINVNMTSVCQMTRLVLPRMVERSKGVVLNISSASGMYPVPLLTVYSSSKASASHRPPHTHVYTLNTHTLYTLHHLTPTASQFLSVLFCPLLLISVCLHTDLVEQFQ